MSKSMKGNQPPTQQEIAARAHSIYEKEGRPDGRATQHWLQAESQLIAESKETQQNQQQESAPSLARDEGTARTESWSAPARGQQPVGRR